MRRMNLVIVAGGLLIAAILTLSSCAAPKGGIVILENPNGTGFMMDFSAWSERSKCELSLNRGDVLQIEVTRESGWIGLTISGKNGSEPYTGNDLQTGLFTVTASETDKYVFTIIGGDAAGTVVVKNLGQKS